MVSENSLTGLGILLSVINCLKIVKSALYLCYFNYQSQIENSKALFLGIEDFEK
jgi:hypothetical protein